jgi:hypothetical protein
MPVFVINADPTFDITSIARREGLDLFNDQRVQLIEALGDTPRNSQIERLWGDWPPRLEGNRNNLHAEIERIIAAASTKRDQNHVIMFVLNEFAPGNPAQHVRGDLLMEIKQTIEGRDRQGHGIETAAPAQNVWVVVFLRSAQDAEEMARRAHAENRDNLVNNIFASVFNGKETDRVAADFLALRILTEMLLDDAESRRFLQVGIQNVYPVTCVIVPMKASGGGASALLQRALSETLDKLEARDVPAAGSVAISAPATRLSKLVDQLVERAREGVDVQPTVDAASADLGQVKKLDASLGSPAHENTAAAARLDSILSPYVTGVRWRPRNGFAGVRTQLAAEISREENHHSHETEGWAQHRAEKLKSFSSINFEIGKTINDISKAAVGSRGNDIRVLEELVAEVRRERNELKLVAQNCRTSTNPADDRAGIAIQRMARVHAAQHAFEFELDQTADPRSISCYLLASLLPATLPFVTLAFSDVSRVPVYLTLALALPLLVILGCAMAIARRRRKLKQAASDLRDEFATWREALTRSFNHALRYQTATLAIGWLTSISERLEQIKHSIELRSKALQDCREMLGTNISVDSQSHRMVADLITTSVDRLRTFEWDKWIVEFLGGARAIGMSAEIRVFLANDGETRTVRVPGLAPVEAPGSPRADLEIRTPHALAAWPPGNGNDPGPPDTRPSVSAGVGEGRAQWAG